MRGKPRYARADKGRIFHKIRLGATSALCGFRPSGPWFIRMDLKFQPTEATCAKCELLASELLTRTTTAVPGNSDDDATAKSTSAPKIGKTSEQTGGES